MKKLLCLAFALLLTMTTLFSVACGKGGNNGDKPSGGGDTPSEKIVIDIDKDISADITIAVPGGNSNERTMIKCLIDDFAEMYPNVNIDMSFVTVNSYVSDVMNLAAAQKAGKDVMPDILWTNSPDYLEIADAGIYEDLTPYIEATEQAGKMNFEEEFYTEYFRMGELKGKKYVVPRSCDSIVTFINTELFEKAGIDMTKVKNGWTWETFMDVCAQMRSWMDKNGKADCYVIDANLTTWLSVCYPMLSAYGSEPIDDNGKNSISNAKTMQCLEMVREMVNKKYICDTQNATTKSFENGGSAMIFQSASVSVYADKLALKNKIDLVSFPLITVNNTPKIGAGIAGYSIAKTSKNKNVAWAFLRYLLSKDGQQKMALNGLNLASIRKDLSDYTTANWGLKYKDLNLAAYTYGSEYKTACEFFTKADLSAKADIQKAIQTMFAGASNASKDLTKVMATAKADIDDALIF